MTCDCCGDDETQTHRFCCKDGFWRGNCSCKKFNLIEETALGATADYFINKQHDEIERLKVQLSASQAFIKRVCWYLRGEDDMFCQNMAADGEALLK